MAKEEEKKLEKQARSSAKKVKEKVSAVARPVADAAGQTVDGLKRFAELEASGGILLIIAAGLALAVSNSSLAELYNDIFHAKIAVKFGPYDYGKSFLHWINDGFMAIFFFVVGLEIKREFLEGELNSVSKLVLPLCAAVGGMVFPAAVYLTITDGGGGDARLAEGWAIPTATDIAFALGTLALLANRIPSSVSVFLLSLAIFDDLGAIIIIAIFYAGKISITAIWIASLLLGILMLMNALGVRRIIPYLAVGLLLWLAVVESGVHATVAGVLLAFTIPLERKKQFSPLTFLEDKLHPWTVFLILPLFAFANAGVSFDGMSPDVFKETMTLGIIVGLVIGKPIGVLVSAVVAVNALGAKLPDDANWGMMAGVACLAGIGFTMSLFIGTLAYDTSVFDAQIRIGVLGGSLMAGLFGLIFLKFSTRHI